MKQVKKQEGFTIIELVVVILLLGILTATALPRFMDVTDEAHGAVVDGVRSGLQTSSAMAHASWIARGEPTTLSDYGGLTANAAGFLVGSNTVSIKDNDDCVDIFTTLLQTGRPSIQAATATGVLAAADVSPSTSDFVAAVNDETCEYAYTGQYTAAAAGDIPVLIYDAADGSVTSGTAL